MIRLLFWDILWICTLCSIDIDVKYTDGLHIKFNGWGTPLLNWLKRKA